MERKHLELKREGDWIIASTPDVDRDRDRVMPMGLSLDNYRKNPVLFYGHSYAEPWNLIGKAAEIEQDASGLRIRAELREPANDTDPMHIVRSLWDSGLLRAASIGFQPLEAQPNEKGGRDIQRAELMEISLVPIPANQNALRLAAKAVDIADDDPPFVSLPQVEQDLSGYIEIQPTDNGASPYVAITSNAPELLWRSQGGSITTTTGGTWTVHVINTLADTKEPAEVSEEAKQEDVTAEPEAETPAPDADEHSDGDTPETQAVIDARFAAILADFVASVRPYLLQS